jgi:hypothetical protein
VISFLVNRELRVQIEYNQMVINLYLIQLSNQMCEKIVVFVELLLKMMIYLRHLVHLVENVGHHFQ